MVFRRTLEDLRARSRAERTALAAWIAIGVVAILFVCWIVYFFHSIETTPAPNLQTEENSLNANGLQQADQQFQQAYGSTTQFIESEGSVQLQPIGTSTQPSQ